MQKIPFLFIVSAILFLIVPAVAVASPSHAGGKMAAHDVVTPAMLAQGKEVYEKNCAGCHATGAAGAPKFGDRMAWKGHIAAGLGHMTENAIRGEGAMPPRGGNPKLSDAEVRAAVAYIREHSR